jgi:hypothetical protein
MPILTSLDEFGSVLQIASGCAASQLAACVHPAAASTTDTAPPDDGRDYYHEAGAWVPRPDRPSLAHQWRPAERAWVDPRTLDELRAAAWARIKVERDRIEFGGFDWDGSRFDSDEISQSRIQGTVLLAQLAIQAGQPFSIAWTLADNTRRTLSAQEVAAVGVAMGGHIRAAHDTAAALRDLINAATTAAALEAITWP